MARAPLRGGRVVGLREGGDSSITTGLVRLRVKTWVALATDGEWQSVRVRRERREEAKGRARRHRDIAFAHRARNGPCDQCEQGGLVSWRLRARRIAGSVTRRRGGALAHQPSGGGTGYRFASDRAIPLPSQAEGAFV